MDGASVAGPRESDMDSSVEASSDKDRPQLGRSSSLPSYDEAVSYSGSCDEDGGTAVEVTDATEQEEGGREEAGGGGDMAEVEGGGCADDQQEVTAPEMDGGDGSKLAEAGAGSAKGEEEEEEEAIAARDDVSVSTSTTATARSTSVQREANASGDDVPHTPMTAAKTAAATAERVTPTRRARPTKRKQQPARAAGTRRSSPSREAAMPWEPIDPSGGPPAVRITGSSQPSPSPVAPGRGGGSGGVGTPQGFQPSTFKEMMTGVRDSPRAEEFGAAAWDSPSQSRADGDVGEEEEEQEAAPRHGGGVVVQYKGGSSNAVTVRKMAELESIWGSGAAAAAAAASADDGGNDWRRASGRYRRINGEYRPPKTAAAAASNTNTTMTTTKNALYGGAGGPLGQPAWSLDGTADKAATVAAALSGAGETGKGASASGKRQQKRSKGVGKKIYRMFGRKTEAK